MAAATSRAASLQRTAGSAPIRAALPARTSVRSTGADGAPDDGDLFQEHLPDTRSHPQSVRSRADCSDAAFVAPRQHVKLRQHGRLEPAIRGDLAGEPAEALQKILDICL